MVSKACHLDSWTHDKQKQTSSLPESGGERVSKSLLTKCQASKQSAPFVAIERQGYH